ncbi:alpha/beta fold hydrolase [Streptoalloteichus hindustanus]|uniref:Pimeloyl-ACP methyl ester carboxylesterase n=1 Tax=Streptoalloteichus hindustanus TaxID=2017 RepID=A0A1M5FEF1_STRHI|nr:alpha/beta hydrolase [Streptoalloteichus hindustanus]SHF89893.1 Pimeloyl-ACP methyl ester carboxylesterase [Streptoalloteichus hindustanus]
MQHPDNHTTTITDAPPVGRRVEVGGRRLFVHQSGTGGPAVVFLPGASAVGLDYLNVHDRASQFTTSVLYDRSGTGWSDPAALPRTGDEAVDELRGLLRAAGVPAPYVLVGHSFGGVLARRFAQRFPAEIAGLLLLEPAHEDWNAFMPEPLRLPERPGEPVPLPELTEQLVREFRELLTRMFAPWPQDIREMLVEHHLNPATLHVGAVEGGSLPALYDELRRGGATPDVPLIVCSGTGIDPGQRHFLPEELLRPLNEGKLALYTALADSVPRGEHRVFEDGSHSWLHVEYEDEVIQALRDLLHRTR